MLNIKKTLAASTTVALALTLFTGSVLAAPNEQGQCRQDAHDLFVTTSSEGTRGDFMSDVIFGNEPNEDADGNTVPSQSPGPWVNNPQDPDNPTFGFTGGDLQALVRTTCGL